MQLKVKGMQLKAMQLKVSMQKNIGERGSTHGLNFVGMIEPCG